jgi:hypothetical protein
VIKRSLSASGIQLRSKGGGRNGFSSSSSCFDFGAITTTVPARKTMLVGATVDGGENSVNFSGVMNG